MELSEKEKLELYDSYLCEVEYEFGTTEKALSYKEFCEEWEGYWDCYF